MNWSAMYGFLACVALLVLKATYECADEAEKISKWKERDMWIRWAKRAAALFVVFGALSALNWSR